MNITRYVPEYYYFRILTDLDRLLLKYLNENVVRWLPVKVRNLLADYLRLKANATSLEKAGFYDYSFLMTPAFKAFEGTLIKVGEELGLNIDKKPHKISVGSILNEDNLEKFYTEVLDKIDSLEKEKKEDIKEWLSNARRYLKSLRHTPAHFLGDIQDTRNKAIMSADTILKTINELCGSMIDNGLFPSIKKEEERKAKEQTKKWKDRKIVGEL